MMFAYPSSGRGSRRGADRARRRGDDLRVRIFAHIVIALTMVAAIVLITLVRTDLLALLIDTLRDGAER